MGIVVDYSEAFRKRMVQRMSAPRATSATLLAAEVGVPQPTLSRWLREASTVEAVAKRKPRSKRARAPVAPVRPVSAWSAEEKVAVVMDAASVAESDLGAWLRAKGLHEEDLARFRDEVRGAAVAGLGLERDRLFDSLVVGGFNHRVPPSPKRAATTAQQVAGC